MTVEMGPPPAPCVPAYRWRLQDRTTVFGTWCPWCRVVHGYAWPEATARPRMAHCATRESPFCARYYRLVCLGELKDGVYAPTLAQAEMIAAVKRLSAPGGRGSAADSSIAAIPAYRLRSSPMHLAFWCPWCRDVHLHGAAAGDGHRVAHCDVESSPFRDGGYHLTCFGTAPSGRLLPHQTAHELLVVSKMLGDREAMS